jgi:DNA end-binding protein Ku
MVVLTDEDLTDLPLSSSRAVDVVEFVSLESIDPIYFDHTYYLEPDPLGVTPYTLLRDAMRDTGQVAVAKIALRQRESLAVLRVQGDVLVLETMLWPDEVRKPDFAFLKQPAPAVRAQELAMAGSLIDSLSTGVFHPEDYSDSYREALEAVIEAKVAGREVTSPPVSTEAPTSATDLMSALKASVEAAKKNRAAGDGAAGAEKKAASEEQDEESAPAKKTPARKAPAKRAPAKQAAAKKAPAKSATAKRAASARKSA